MSDAKDTIEYAVIGDPINHSLSPVMQNAGLTALGMATRYGAIHVKPNELKTFTERAKTTLRGFNITVPHKNAIIPLLDEVSPECQRSGSVNTVSVIDGTLVGTSTDGPGLEAALNEAFNLVVTDTRFCFIGAGGATRAVAFHFAARGAGALFLLNRTLSKAEELAERLADFAPNLRVETASVNDAEAVKRLMAESDAAIQATSLGLRPDDPPPIPPETLHEGLVYYDTIYKRTPLLVQAEKMGIKTADGRGMLLHQGAKSLSIWTDSPAPVEAMRNALYEAMG